MMTNRWAFARAACFCVAAAFFLCPILAFAQTVAPTSVAIVPPGSTTVMLGGIINFAESILASVLIAILIWAAQRAATWFNLKITDADWTTIHSAALNAAGRLWASAEPSIATAKVDVGSPLIASYAAKALQEIPTEAAAQGITADKMAALVAGKLGQLQAKAAPAPAAAAAP